MIDVLSTTADILPVPLILDETVASPSRFALVPVALWRFADKADKESIWAKIAPLPVRLADTIDVLSITDVSAILALSDPLQLARPFTVLFIEPLPNKSAVVVAAPSIILEILGTKDAVATPLTIVDNDPSATIEDRTFAIPLTVLFKSATTDRVANPVVVLESAPSPTRTAETDDVPLIVPFKSRVASRVVEPAIVLERAPSPTRMPLTTAVQLTALLMLGVDVTVELPDMVLLISGTANTVAELDTVVERLPEAAIFADTTEEAVIVPLISYKAARVAETVDEPTILEAQAPSPLMEAARVATPTIVLLMSGIALTTEVPAMLVLISEVASTVLLPLILADMLPVATMLADTAAMLLMMLVATTSPTNAAEVLPTAEIVDTSAPSPSSAADVVVLPAIVLLRLEIADTVAELTIVLAILPVPIKLAELAAMPVIVLLILGAAEIVAIPAAVPLSTPAPNKLAVMVLVSVTVILKLPLPKRVATGISLVLLMVAEIAQTIVAVTVDDPVIVAVPLIVLATNSSISNGRSGLSAKGKSGSNQLVAAIMRQLHCQVIVIIA